MALSAQEIAEILARTPVILIVDDDPTFRALAKDYLRHYDCTIAEVSDGDAAVKFVTETKPDLIMLDLRMPGMDGVETMRRLKDVAPTVPVAIVSGYLREYDANKILDFGVLTCIRKPMSPSDFVPLFETLKIRVRPNYPV